MIATAQCKRRMSHHETKHQVGSQSDSSCPEKRANSLRAFNTNIFRNSIQWHALLGRLVLNGLHQSCVIRCPCFSASGVLAEACPFGTTPHMPTVQPSFLETDVHIYCELQLQLQFKFLQPDFLKIVDALFDALARLEI